MEQFVEITKRFRATPTAVKRINQLYGTQFGYVRGEDNAVMDIFVDPMKLAKGIGLVWLWNKLDNPPENSESLVCVYEEYHIFNDFLKPDEITFI